MKFVSYLQLIFVFLLSSIMLSQCSMLSFGGDNQVLLNQQTLAYYVPQRRSEFVGRKMIKVRGDLNTIVNLVSEVVNVNTGANSNVIRNQNIEANYGGTRDLLKVQTVPIEVDSLDKFKEHFLLGYYLLENPNFVIKPENLTYTVEAGISIRGQDFYIEFKLAGSVIWDVYEIKKKGKLKKQSESFKHSIGVGVYKAKKEITKVSRVGNEITEYEPIIVPIKDQPISKGVTELKYIDILMEKFAINEVAATVVIQ